MAIRNPAALHLIVPDYPLDQIIGYFTGTVTVAASSGSPVQVTTSIPHDFGDSCYFQGVFTTDGGATFNDFGAETPNLTTPTNPVLSTFDCNATTDTTNVNIIMTNFFDTLHGTSVPVTATYKIYLLAKNTMAQPVTPLPTNQKLSFSSKFNFQQIAHKDTLNLNVASGATGSASFIHNLGYVPVVRAFLFETASPTICKPIIYSPGIGIQGGIDSIQVQLTSTTLTFFTDQGSFLSLGLNASIEYRIYL